MRPMIKWFNLMALGDSETLEGREMRECDGRASIIALHSEILHEGSIGSYKLQCGRRTMMSRRFEVGEERALDGGGADDEIMPTQASLCGEVSAVRTVHRQKSR